MKTQCIFSVVAASVVLGVGVLIGVKNTQINSVVQTQKIKVAAPSKVDISHWDTYAGSGFTIKKPVDWKVEKYEAKNRRGNDVLVYVFGTGDVAHVKVAATSYPDERSAADFESHIFLVTGGDDLSQAKRENISIDGKVVPRFTYTGIDDVYSDISWFFFAKGNVEYSVSTTDAPENPLGKAAVETFHLN